MLDIEIFANKLREHRRAHSLTQEEVAEKIGVSAQAVSKWESGQALPDCFNLKAIGDVYGISLDVLLETDAADINKTASKIEQIADEYIWSKEYRAPDSHIDLGEDMWKIWKEIYFIEVGDRQKQIEDHARGELRVCSDYGMKIWDDDGVACVVRSDLREKLSFGENEEKLIFELSSREGLKLISLLDTVRPVSKEYLLECSEIVPTRLNELLLYFIENRIVEHTNPGISDSQGYKLCAHRGIVGYMLLAAVHILSKSKYTVSEFFPN